MGWSNGGAYRSATGMYELSTHMSHVLTGAQWRIVQPLFHLAEHADNGPFRIQPGDAAGMAQVFRAAADHRLMPEFWATSARQLADVADRHAQNGQPWEWR